MVQPRMRSLVLERMGMVVVIGCVMGLLSGCNSSRLRTTIVSGSEAKTVDVAQLKEERLVAEEIIAQPNQKNLIMDIPVEDPAIPGTQPEVVSDIFATPKTSDSLSEIDAPLESVPASASPGEQIASSMALPVEPAKQPMAGIPPISYEPEMPAVPRPAPDEVSSASQENRVASDVRPDSQLPVQPAREPLQDAPVASIVEPGISLPVQPAGEPLQDAPVVSIVEPGISLPVQPAGEPLQDAPVASIVGPGISLPVQPQPVEPASQDSSGEEPQVAQADLPTTSEPSAGKAPIQIVKVMPQDQGMGEMTTETLEAALSDIYFDYDKFLIRDNEMPQLQVNAQLFTTKFADKQIVIEGHCDERGTRSYNMVLGKRRAHAVKHFLEDLGVPAENLQAVSYGKDRPFCTESTQDCWQENRRGHFLIQ